MLPIVVHVGTEPWKEPMRLEDVLTDEAKAFLPLAMGKNAVLVSETEEARDLEHVEEGVGGGAEVALHHG